MHEMEWVCAEGRPRSAAAGWAVTAGWQARQPWHRSVASRRCRHAASRGLTRPTPPQAGGPPKRSGRRCAPRPPPPRWRWHRGQTGLHGPPLKPEWGGAGAQGSRGGPRDRQGPTGGPGAPLPRLRPQQRRRRQQPSPTCTAHASLHCLLPPRSAPMSACTRRSSAECTSASRPAVLPRASAASSSSAYGWAGLK